MTNLIIKLRSQFGTLGSSSRQISIQYDSRVVSYHHKLLYRIDRCSSWSDFFKLEKFESFATDNFELFFVQEVLSRLLFYHEAELLRDLPDAVNAPLHCRRLDRIEKGKTGLRRAVVTGNRRDNLQPWTMLILLQTCHVIGKIIFSPHRPVDSFKFSFKLSEVTGGMF